MTRESAGVSALATNAFLHEGMTKRGCRVCDSPSFFIYGYPVVLSGYIVSFPTSGMFPRKPVAGFYESHDSFIGHGIIQHDGNPQFVVHVIGRIDAGNLVEAVRLFRPDFTLRISICSGLSSLSRTARVTLIIRANHFRLREWRNVP